MGQWDIPTAVFVFLAMVVTDILNVYYVRRVAQGRALQASAVSFSITLVAALVTINYVENKIYVIPVALGALVGTFISIKIDTKKAGKR